jgi:cytochrome c biogenesis protein CcmG, thiol:disulfide interchange protein DsbE
MGEQPYPGSMPRGASPEGDPRSPRRSWMQRVRGLSTTAKVVYGGAAVLVVAVIVVALTGVLSGKPKAGPLPLATNFTLVQVGDPGHTVSLAQYAGHPVVINFFASWCTPCKQETPLVASFYKHMDGKVVVIGIDAQDKASNALKFMRTAGVAYPVGFEPSPAVADSYGVAGIPQTFFLNARHRIVEHVYGAVTLKELTDGVALMDSSHQPASGVTVLGQDEG